MGLLPAPGIGLIGSLAFHAGPAVTESVARVVRGGIFNSSRRLRKVSTKRRLVLQSRASTRQGTAAVNYNFGFFPKISTPVENIVEKRPGGTIAAQKTTFLAKCTGAKVVDSLILGRAQRVSARKEA